MDFLRNHYNYSEDECKISTMSHIIESYAFSEFVSEIEGIPERQNEIDY